MFSLSLTLQPHSAHSFFLLDHDLFEVDEEHLPLVQGQLVPDTHSPHKPASSVEATSELNHAVCEGSELGGDDPLNLGSRPDALVGEEVVPLLALPDLNVGSHVPRLPSLRHGGVV